MRLTAPGTPGALAGTVSLVEHIGAESVIGVALDGVNTAHDDDGGLTREVMVTLPGYADTRAGAAVGVAFDLAAFSLFDRESGARVGGDAARG
jgi:multiple sugar transport system ATP-binding protein